MHHLSTRVSLDGVLRDIDVEVFLVRCSFERL